TRAWTGGFESRYAGRPEADEEIVIADACTATNIPATSTAAMIGSRRGSPAILVMPRPNRPSSWSLCLMAHLCVLLRCVASDFRHRHVSRALMCASPAPGRDDDPRETHLVRCSNRWCRWWPPAAPARHPSHI